MINFLEVEQSVKKLRQQLRQGEIDERTFEEALLDLIDQAEDGYYWMYGHETGRWYRHDGEKWVPRDPGELFVSLDNVISHESIQKNSQTVHWGWFVASLLVLILIAVAVFYSAL